MNGRDSHEIASGTRPPMELRRSASCAVVAALSLVACGLLTKPAAAQQRQFTYTVESRGKVGSPLWDRFAAIAEATLSDIRGWTLNHNVRYVRVRSGGDFRLVLATPEEVAAASPACSSYWSCRVGELVLINERRWRNATPTWPYSRRAYRSYVINHEVGHWLGLGHASCPGRGKAAPVMMQQSKRLNGCKARVWPLFGERARVVAIRGVRSRPGWPTPAATAPCTIQRGHHDDHLVGTNHADVICGEGGDDHVEGRGGHDLLRGGAGDDLLRAARADLIVGGRGRDRLNGGRGNDVLRGKRGGDSIVGSYGNDRITGGRGNDSLRGSRGHDVILGERGHDRIYGGRGNDRLGGGPGDDAVDGGPGRRDRCRGGRGNDALRRCER